MARTKLRKFNENKQNPLILEGNDFPDGIDWLHAFGNEYPVTLEIGCGRGDYSIALAKRFPQRNFIGVDIKGDRLWYGANFAQTETLQNCLFLRTRIEQIDRFFAPATINEIWITFPGPRPKKTQANRRLTNHKFLDLYKSILREGGTIHLKTDSDFAYTYTLGILEERDDMLIVSATDDIYGYASDVLLTDIQTHFEMRFLKDNMTIKHIAFQFV
ncbi:MAG: tRNA (guanosine(46)-N7)-methyltransferase TrmB [bacterium]|nr:tRNA (guanosine(46)-N7)-methyltransferase TrmB [bacterium]MDA1024505.1 tRNA (guanosine(46)-N7)-methyltransferase TrmB [bacterium]